MRTIGNLIWFFAGGLFTGGLWLSAGILWSLTLIGIPVGLQCFKIARLCFFPFNKRVAVTWGGAASLILNLVWISTTGWMLAVEAVTAGLLCYITIIGIPFGKQYFKIAGLALMPFGKEII